MSLAARGARRLDDVEENIEDEELKAQLRRQAARVYFKAMMAGALLAAFFFLLPF